MMRRSVTPLVKTLGRVRRVILRALEPDNGHAVPNICSPSCRVISVGPNQADRLRLAYAGRV